MSYYNKAELEEQEEELIQEVEDCEKSFADDKESLNNAVRWVAQSEKNLEKAKKDLLDFKSRD